MIMAGVKLSKRAKEIERLLLKCSEKYKYCMKDCPAWKECQRIFDLNCTDETMTGNKQLRTILELRKAGVEI
jgi:hypothetical protein